MTRREFFLTAGALSQLPGAARNKMGIASTSFGAAPAPPGAPRRRDTLQFLEKCHALGAGGIQASINGDIPKLRARAEDLGMWIEGMASVPRNGDVAALERSLADAKAAGAVAVRVALFGGRRYENFPTLADWTRWVDETHKAMRLAMPVIERQKVPFAIENHKDWTLDDMQRLLNTYSSEYVGVCLDFGNNIALLDDPMEMTEALLPYVRSTHVKDMAVAPYADGFLLSEVPLGMGVLDLRRIMSMIQKAHPHVRFSLEMITRDPLKVPCLTPHYWTVFPDRNGKYLAQTLKLVQQRASTLPAVSQLSPEDRARVEEENVKACLRYVQEKQLIG